MFGLALSASKQLAKVINRGRELMGNSDDQKSADMDQQCLPVAGENSSLPYIITPY